VLGLLEGDEEHDAPPRAARPPAFRRAGDLGLRTMHP
jgi:hypothetical protein